MTVKGLSFGFILSGILLISGCSQINTTPPSSIVKPKPPASKQQAWQQRQAFLARKPSWRLNSKASLRFDDENLIFGLNWAQLPSNNYVIHVAVKPLSLLSNR